MIDRYHRAGINYRGIDIRKYDVPCTPWVWTSCETDGLGSAETLDEAQEQIDRHLTGREEAA
ncbi:hypothetical protein RGQ15_07010 [Paracoccus sp. MBLB3053]|uniref:Uncharacterized protein n=1 Tax=Paracoccus aurantius TaxID=3073814 RepID=A0ABU2HQJ6_9RHOB|nr:hypothetical protein [Paracoccus sp. MBLB3053]MDS9467322.1 hypothetical protein [Paracoccus sp. MBLB3053]